MVDESCQVDIVKEWVLNEEGTASASVARVMTRADKHGLMSRRVVTNTIFGSDNNIRMILTHKSGESKEESVEYLRR